MPTLDEFRSKSGEFAEVPDAEVQEPGAEETEAPIDEPVTEEVEDTTEETIEPTVDGQETAPYASDDGEDIDLSPKEKTAFEKRLERERRKLEEKLRQEMESQYNPYKEVVSTLGGDPAKILETIKHNQMMQQAQQLADQYGWDDSQTQYYIQQEQAKQQQEKLQRELQELRIANEISEIADNPNFAGIKEMKASIIDKVMKSNGSLNAQEAYWAIGGPQRAEQLRLEAEQREIAKRAQQKRTVQTDAAASVTGEKPLPPGIEAEARRLGMTPQEARELLNFNATNIHEARKLKKAK